MKYKIREAAYRDLDEIWFYTFQKWSEKQADTYFYLIIQEIEILSNNPSKAKRVPITTVDYFFCRALSHYVFFKYDDDTIEIIRILHKMMDFSKHLE
ncbi:MAG: plasmid stabilization protein [Flavobacterium sp. BFFFF2]|nr:MAG: plasmid stabilization protein [Flavobacterium sp. BFFFF2]